MGFKMYCDIISGKKGHSISRRTQFHRLNTEKFGVNGCGGSALSFPGHL